MSSPRADQDEDKRRKAIYAGNHGIRRDVWAEAMRITKQSERSRRKEREEETR